ncbi:Protein RESTRICTED TEV MOVEMENT 2 [Morella rubra]|uniref:Protein RESTRICTED TEV MOVEMENT 2 n=1 Tax=Morella rubra TaxID=262757 RepID=A0A6A1WLT0_9ROSI|nr:Protein RESTRICTED TEV MOVEMENT 2 [Morella rubra]
MSTRQHPRELSTASFLQSENSIVYEDFQPNIEGKEEEAPYIALFRFPAGFVKEQVRIIYFNPTRRIRIQGERTLEDNRKSQFDASFLVPENCDTEKMQANFEQGILTITMPIKTALDSAKQKAVKNLARRQMLRNVGAAVLVIGAIGAYVYYYK